MKKLLILAAALVMGASLNAAAFTWKFTSNAGDAGSTVYVYTGVETTFANLAAITDYAATGEAILTTSGRATAASSTAKSSAITKTSADFYFVVVNSEGTGYWLSDKQNALLGNNDGTKDLGYVYDADALESQNGTLTFNTSKAALSYTAFAPVPEPTSGLLLLLGMGALALRRKCA